MRKYISALLLPGGRLNRFGFVVLFLPVMFALHWLHQHLCEVRADAEGWLMGGYLVLLWNQYCLMSRRLHDAELPGIFFFFPYAAVAGAFMAEVDPSVLRGFGDEETMLAHAETARQYGLGVIGAVWVYLMAAEGNEGENKYGQPFDYTPARQVRFNPEQVNRLSGGRLSYAAMDRFETPQRDVSQPPRRGTDRPTRRKGFGHR